MTWSPGIYFHFMDFAVTLDNGHFMPTELMVLYMFTRKQNSATEDIVEGTIRVVDHFSREQHLPLCLSQCEHSAVRRSAIPTVRSGDRHGDRARLPRVAHQLSPRATSTRDYLV